MVRQRISYIAKSLYAATFGITMNATFLEQFGRYSYDMDITYVPLLAFGSVFAFVMALSWRITFDSCNDLGFAIPTIV